MKATASVKRALKTGNPSGAIPAAKKGEEKKTTLGPNALAYLRSIPNFKDAERSVQISDMVAERARRMAAGETVEPIDVLAALSLPRATERKAG